MTKFELVMKGLPKLCGGMAVTHFKENFRRQGFLAATVESWAKRNDSSWGKKSKKKTERAILVKSGILKRSIRVVQEGTDFVKIGSDVPYAQVHNEGFSGSVSQSVKPFTRKGKPVKGYSRTINQKIPKRQFMGYSQSLENDMEKVITERIHQAIRTS